MLQVTSLMLFACLTPSTEGGATLVADSRTGHSRCAPTASWSSGSSGTVGF